MKKVMVLNNFGMFPINPPNSTSRVCGLLRKKSNAVVKQIDINLTLWNKILSVEYISKCEYHGERVQNTKVAFCPHISRSSFQEIKCNVIDNLDVATEIIKNKEKFSDVKLLTWAVDIIFQAQQVIYYTYGTFIHNKMIFWPHIGSDMNNIQKVFELSQDVEYNPLIELIESNIIPQLIEYNPDIIGVDILFPWEIVQVVTLNKLIKKYLPNVHINYMGYGFDEFCYSRIATDLVQNKLLMLGFDSVFLVRNDDGLLNLYSEMNSDISQIKSIAYLDKDGAIVVNKPFYENVIINDITPDYSDLDLSDYFSPEVVFTDKLSNKCFWNKCTFCNINKFKSERCEVDVEKYIDMVQEYITKYKCKNLFLLDEAATPELVRKFSQGLLDRKVNINWSIRTRIDEGFDEELIELMYNAGCREMWIGFEAASKSLLRKMNKTDNPERYIEIAKREMRDCQKHRIGLHFCLLLGFPNELESDRNELKMFFEETRKYISKVPFFVTYNVFNLNIGSYIYDNFQEFGIEKIIYDVDKFNMINVPFIRKDTGMEQKYVEDELEKFCNSLTSLFVRNPVDQLLWFNVADSAWEMLMKKYSHANPFQKEVPLLSKMGVVIGFVLSKNAIGLKIVNRISKRKMKKQNPVLFH